MIGGTFGSILRDNQGIGPGFDFLRLALAFGVVTFHAFQLNYGTAWTSDMQARPLFFLLIYIVPAFFALSGFLVAGSMVRLGKVTTFLIFRALRIFPALAVEVVLSALLLGPLVTALPVQAYFTDAKFLAYFSNLLGIVRYQLPGAFLDNPVPDVVNGQLWTVPSELYCYIALAVLMVLGLATRRWIFLAAFLAFSLLECAIGMLPGRNYTAGVLTSPESLVLCFLCGNVLYLFREFIPCSVVILAGAIAGALISMYLLPVVALFLGVVSIAYVIVFLGMQPILRVPALQSGDYSYGVYLYSFPLQQTLCWAFPGLREWYWSLLIGGAASILCAMASWHLVERPALGLRKAIAAKLAPKSHG